MHKIQRQLYLDHHHIQRLLHCLNKEIDCYDFNSKRAADLAVILSALDYIVSYPDKWHHPTEDIIFGQMRQVIASMQIEDINRDRELFLTQIQSSLEPELKKIGLVLINVNITDITDESGYIEAIGRKAASEAVQKARGDVADQVKLGEVRVAQAEREKKVEVANAQKLQHIGIREADREQAVRIAELAKEQEVGEKEALFLQEMAVAEAAQRKRIAVADANATASVGEKEAELKQEVQIADADQKRRVSVAELNANAIAGEAESAAQVAHAKAELQFKQAEAYQP